MIDHEGVLQVLRERLFTVETVETEKLACLNRSFSPPESGLWFRESYLPAAEPLIANSQLMAEGLYQIDVFCLAGRGHEEAFRVAKRIGEAFKPAQSLVSGKVSVELVRVEPGSGRIGRAALVHVPRDGKVALLH